MSHENLDIYKLSHKLALIIHTLSLDLPNYEKYEEGSQIRRSSKGVSSNIVEGYALRTYKKEFIRYLHLAYASCQETREHLKYLYETNSLKDGKMYDEVKDGYESLSKMIYSFIEAVNRGHYSEK